MSHFLEIDNLTVSYRGTPALHHINLKLKCGSCVGLLGPNGAGKTTLLKAIAGLVERETGRITLHGHTAAQSRREISYLPQRELIDWDFPTTVRGLIEMGRYSHLGRWKLFSEKDGQIVNSALKTLKLEDLAQRQINALSGGQQQRAFVARAYAQQAHVYLLDEPFNGLDKNAQAELQLALRQLSKEGSLILISHHNLKTVPELFDEVILLNGELVAYGPVQEVFIPDLIEKTFATKVFTG